MKSLWIFPIALLAAFIAVPAAMGNDLLPEDKVAEEVLDGERNPFIRRGPATATTVIEDRESEESRLRSILETMQVAGFSEGPQGNGVLLGIFRLKVGYELPVLIQDQTERLRVSGIFPDKVELVFLEPEEKEENRTVVLRYSLRPQIRYLLGSQIPPIPDTSTLKGRFPPNSLLLKNDSPQEE